ncbi:MAG: 23S rRNA (guanosine(2251)-2'-O)-methyltransferase RlmB [Actinobacteria bacterium]|nr:23S rRNA (guanosine(2251)-2'-O)-methyltransferase RlmB [Actinomycetota bacterium]
MSEVIWGRRPVAEALSAGSPIELILIADGVSESGVVQEVLELARARDIPVERIERKALLRLIGSDKHQGIAARVPAFEYAPSKQVVESKPARILLLDGVTDPVNLGSILRSAEAFGFTGVLIGRNRSVGVTPTVRKVAAGAAERVPVANVGSPAETIARLSRSGIFVVGLDPEGTAEYDSFDYPSDSLCLVVGAEGAGLSQLVKRRCDELIRIPMAGAMASINVAVAAAVVMSRIVSVRGHLSGEE